MPRYRVIAPVVIVKTRGDHGWHYKHLQKGATVPADAEEEWIGYHLRDRMIAEIAAKPPEAAPAPEPAPPPAAEAKPAEPKLAEDKPPPARRGPQQRGG